MSPSSKQVLKTASLGEVCTFQGGTQPPQKTFRYEPARDYVRLLQIRDFESDEHATYVSQEFNLRYVDKSDVLLARYGASVGKILTGKAGAINVALMKAMPDERVVSKPFLYFFLHTDGVQRYLKGLGGRSAQAGFNQGEISRIQIPLPPLREQHAIVQALRAVQEAKEARQRELMVERERKAALMQYLFTHGTRSEAVKQTEIGEIPKSWEEKTIGDVATIVSGGTPDRTKSEYWGGTIPWVKTGEIKYNSITTTEETITKEGLDNSSARIIPTGTLLIAMYGQGVTRGRVAILRIEAAINQACAAILTSEIIDNAFLFHFLAYNYNEIRRLGHGANQKNLNAALVRSIPIAVPCLDEQETIANILSSCDTKLRFLEAETFLIQELFKAMLEELMTGRLSAIPLIEAEAAA